MKYLRFSAFSLFFSFVFGLFFCTNNTFADNSQIIDNILVEYTESSTSLTFSSIDDVYSYSSSDINICGFSSYDYPNISFSPPQCSSFDFVLFSSSDILPSLYDEQISFYFDFYSTVPFALVLPSYDTTLSIFGFNGDFFALNYPLTVTFSFISLDSDCPALPSGTLNISVNGTYDVTNYAEAVVNVPSEVIQGDYHDDLISINNSILICAAVCLVIYFFYCIYRMIIKNTGVH